ncbi:PKD domain-containing protein [Fluviicola sp.]|uniref:PKD domain-containing protein n=1 Tax=Fluviicola sp. TaxID=1917219 RepID=UPI003D28DB5E
MKRAFGILLITFTSISPLFTQWNQLPGIPMDDIQCVRAYDSNNFYAGLSNAIITSSDAGLNWQVKPVVDMAGNLMPCIITDVFFTSPSEAIAVGFISLGNSEAILKTTNGGSNWTIANLYNGGNYPRSQTTLDFPTALTGFAAGTNGRILRTYNGGTSWTVLPAITTLEIKDLHFISVFTGYAVADGFIFKTVNGANWTQTPFPGKNFRGIHFPSPLIGYAVGESGVIYKTVNGVAWNQLTFPSNLVDLTSVYFVNDTVGYVTADNFIYRTTSGGLYWEKVIKPSDMNKVTFYSAMEGLACGDDGQLYHTSNSGETYKPQPNFSYSPSLNCYDSIVHFNNLSDPSWSFEWLLNGTVFSTAYSPSIVIPGSGNSTVSLVAVNGLERDTISKNIFIQEALQIDLNLGIPNQICSGQSTQVSVLNSEFGVNYRLRNGTSFIGSQQLGTGGTLTFNTGVIISSVTLNIQATTGNSCGSIEEVEYVNIVVQNPDLNKIIYADPDTICVNDSTTVFLLQSENTVSYQLMNGTTIIGSPAIGSGNTLSFPTPPLIDTTEYFIRGISSPLGCITNFQAFNVIVEDSTIYTSFSNCNPEIGESIEVFNNTFNPNGSYLWNFGPNASPQYSNLSGVPSVSFSNIGLEPVNLTVTTSTGCLKHFTGTINVIDTFALEACSPIHYAADMINFSGRMLSLTRDLNNNLITVYQNADSDSLMIYSENGDQLLNYAYPIPSHGSTYTITKHNPKGVAMWSTNLRLGSGGSKCGDVVTDNAGNFYMAHYYGDHIGDVQIYSADGRYITVVPPHTGNQNSIVIVKYNTNGMYLWHTTLLDFYTVERVSLKLDEVGNILVCGRFFAKIAPNGTILESLLYEHNPDCESDGLGGVYVANGDDLGFVYVGSGTGISFPGYQVTEPNTGISTQYIKKDEDNNYYLLGHFHGGFNYGGTTLSDPYTVGPVHEDIFLCKVNSNGTPGWIKQFKSPAETVIRGFDIKNGTIVLATKTYGGSYQYVGETSFVLNGNGSDLFFKCNKNGHGDVLVLFHEEPILVGYLGSKDLLFLDSTGQKVDLGVEFRTNFSTPSGVVFNTYADPSFGNEAIHCGELACLLNIDAVSPVSGFSADTSGCSTANIQFSDESTGLPISWNWSFPGGSPATSTDENPVVSYPSSGIYTVELTATNEYGIGNTISQSIYLDPCLGLEENSLNGVLLATVEMGVKYRILNVNESSVVKLINNEGREIELSLDETNEIDLQNYAAGIYFLRISHENSMKTFKVLRY